MSSLPLGLNRIKIERSLTTSALAVFVPFVTQEFGKFNIPGCITMSCHAKKYRKIKGIEQSEYPGISRKDTPYYLKKPALLARLLALAVGERSAFA